MDEKTHIVPSGNDGENGMLDVDTSEHSSRLVENESEVILGSEGVSGVGSLRVLELRRRKERRVSPERVVEGREKRREEKKGTNDGKLLRVVDD